MEPDSIQVGQEGTFKVVVELARAADTLRGIPLEHGYPRLHVLKDGSEISGSPFVMRLEEPYPPRRARFRCEVSFSAPGEYWYYVEAVDRQGHKGGGTPRSLHRLMVNP